ncbi:MAG: BamA/TamA family outer membrane protein [Ignavibacteriota bacterium]
MQRTCGASLLSGFGGKAAPPFDRDYLGGEQEVRGFSSWAISPLAYVPGVATIPVLNPDGSPRVVPVLTGGVTTMAAVTIKIPVYRPLAIGGDTKVVANVEYRIPIAGPFTLALFTDAGLDRAVFTSQLKPNAGVIESLSAAFSSEFADRLPIQAESQRIRVSSGAEFQVLIPKIQAPVRLYWAYNVTACTGWSGSFCSTFTPPLVASPGLFPNFATYQSARQMFGVPQIHRDPRSMLRIANRLLILSIGPTWVKIRNYRRGLL